MKVVVVKPHHTNDVTFHVHAEGCKDVKLSKYDVSEAFTMEATSVSDVAVDVYPPDDFMYDPTVDKSYEEDFRVFPCASLNEAT